MKIISVSRSVIVEMSRDELAKVCGLYSEYSWKDHFKEDISKSEGKNINVYKLYGEYKTLREFNARKNEIKKKLKDMHEALAEIENTDYLTISADNYKLTQALKVAEDALRLISDPDENEPNWFHLESRKALVEIKKIKGEV